MLEKILYFISSYVPMFAVMILRALIEYRAIEEDSAMQKLTGITCVSILILISVICICCIYIRAKSIPNNENTTITCKINKAREPILNYSLFVVPCLCIGLSISLYQIQDVIEFVVLFAVLGLLQIPRCNYSNPLWYLFGYICYVCEIYGENGTIGDEVTLLIKKDIDMRSIKCGQAITADNKCREYMIVHDI